MRYRTPSSSRNGVRNPLGEGSPASSAWSVASGLPPAGSSKRAGGFGGRALQGLGGTGHRRRPSG